MVLLSLTLSIALSAASCLASGGSCLPDPQDLWKLSPEDPKLWEILTRHGLACRHQGKFTQAENLLERVVLLVGQIKGRDAIDLAGPLNNLAAVYRDQGRRVEAEPMLQRAGRLTASGNATTRAYVENNLALLYWDRGDLARAEPLLRRAAAGLAGADRIPALANLATLYRSTRRLAAAEELTREVLQTDEAFWQAWRNLAAIHRLRKDFVRAEAALTRTAALAIADPQRAETLFEQALLAIAKREYGPAENAIEQAIAIEERMFGEQSVNLIPYVELQAQVLRQLKDKEGAKEAGLRARLLRAAL